MIKLIRFDVVFCTCWTTKPKLANYEKKRVDFVIFRGGGVPVNPREFNVGTLIFVEVNTLPPPSIVPCLSEIRDLSIITPFPGSLMDALLTQFCRSVTIYIFYFGEREVKDSRRLGMP